MTNLDGLTKHQLVDLADRMLCPDGLRTPYNTFPLPTTRKGLVELIRGLEQRLADSRAIERVVRGG